MFGLLKVKHRLRIFVCISLFRKVKYFKIMAAEFTSSRPIKISYSKFLVRNLVVKYN